MNWKTLRDRLQLLHDYAVDMLYQRPATVVCVALVLGIIIGSTAFAAEPPEYVTARLYSVQGQAMACIEQPGVSAMLCQVMQPVRPIEICIDLGVGQPLDCVPMAQPMQPSAVEPGA